MIHSELWCKETRYTKSSPKKYYHCIYVNRLSLPKDQSNLSCRPQRQAITADQTNELLLSSCSYLFFTYILADGAINGADIFFDDGTAL